MIIRSTNSMSVGWGNNIKRSFESVMKMLSESLLNSLLNVESVRNE